MTGSDDDVNKRPRRAPKAPKPTQPPPRIKYYPPFRAGVIDELRESGARLEALHPLGATQENLAPANNETRLNWTEVFSQDLPRNPHLIRRVVELDLLPPDMVRRIPMPPDMLETRGDTLPRFENPERKTTLRKPPTKKGK